MTFRELCSKEVVQTEDGVCLGQIDDAEFDADTATVKSFIMLGRPKLFGLLGREEDLTIPWSDILKFGIDAVLVRTPLPQGEGHRRRFWFWKK